MLGGNKIEKALANCVKSFHENWRESVGMERKLCEYFDVKL